MPTPPIPPPTPYACANCGAGFGTRADFCPHCGARLNLATAKSAGWYFGTIAFAAMTLGFGSIGACSAWTAGSILLADTKGHLDMPILVMFVLPILLVGTVCAWLCGRALIRRLRE